MYFERSVDIAATPERVWSIFSDVERWHEWTPSVTSVTLLDDRAFGLGSRARVLQPLIRPAVFEVTEFTPGRDFTWMTTNGGILAVARHVVEPMAGGTRATISLDFSGWPVLILRPWLSWLTNRYFRMETAGLKRASEAGQRSPSTTPPPGAPGSRSAP